MNTITLLVAARIIGQDTLTLPGQDTLTFRAKEKVSTAVFTERELPDTLTIQSVEQTPVVQVYYPVNWQFTPVPICTGPNCNQQRYLLIRRWR